MAKIFNDIIMNYLRCRNQSRNSKYSKINNNNKDDDELHNKIYNIKNENNNNISLNENHSVKQKKDVKQKKCNNNIKDIYSRKLFKYVEKKKNIDLDAPRNETNNENNNNIFYNSKNNYTSDILQFENENISFIRNLIIGPFPDETIINCLDKLIYLFGLLVAIIFIKWYDIYTYKIFKILFIYISIIPFILYLNLCSLLLLLLYNKLCVYKYFVK